MEKKFYIKSAYDGLRLSLLEISEGDSPKGTILFIHGLCGCKERHIPAMRHFCEKGFRCFGMDLRGHGDSIYKEEDRGYTYQVGSKGMTEDIRTVISFIKKEFPASPLFIVAHSMGTLATRALLKNEDKDIDGIILCGSVSDSIMSTVALWLTSALAAIDKGRRRYPALQELTTAAYNRRFRKEGRQAWTCSDPEVRKAFTDDPKCNFTPTVDCTLTLLKMMKETYSKKGWNVHNPALPILFISGGDDPCLINLKRFHHSAGFMNTVGYNNVSSIIYLGMRHEVLNEIGKEDIWREIEDFVAQRGS